MQGMLNSSLGYKSLRDSTTTHVFFVIPGVDSDIPEVGNDYSWGLLYWYIPLLNLA